MTKNKSTRKRNGQFAKGNPGGPGRPRRAVERDYMRVLSESVTLDAWAEIVSRAVEDAKAGDLKAREWVARYVLGSEPVSLFEVAKLEALGVESEHEVDAAADSILNPGKGDQAAMLRILNGPSELERAIELAKGDE